MTRPAARTEELGTVSFPPVRQASLTVAKLSEVLRLRSRCSLRSAWPAPRKSPRFEVASVTARRRTDAAEQVQRGADHRDLARARSGRGNAGVVPAPRDLGRDLLQVASQVRRHGGVGGEAA